MAGLSYHSIPARKCSQLGEPQKAPESPTSLGLQLVKQPGLVNPPGSPRLRNKGICHEV